MHSEPAGSRHAVVAARRAERARLSETPTSAHTPLLPRGLAHAALLGAVVTLCGTATTDLNLFPGLAFAAAGFLTRCEDCLARLGDRPAT